MKNITAMSALALMPSTKQQVDNFAGQIINEVACGNENPLALHLKIIALEKSLAKIKEAIKKEAVSEAEKHGQKSFDHMGCKIEIQELGVKYNYEGCGYFKWEKANAELKASESLQKEAETFLKGIKTSEEIVDPDTGECVTVYAPIKTPTTGIKVTLK